MQYSKMNWGMNGGRSMRSDEYWVVVSRSPRYSSMPGATSTHHKGSEDQERSAYEAPRHRYRRGWHYSVAQAQEGRMKGSGCWRTADAGPPDGEVGRFLQPVKQGVRLLDKDLVLYVELLLFCPRDRLRREEPQSTWHSQCVHGAWVGPAPHIVHGNTTRKLGAESNRNISCRV